jgi:hypothetical protein
MYRVPNVLEGPLLEKKRIAAKEKGTKRQDVSGRDATKINTRESGIPHKVEDGIASLAPKILLRPG